MAGSASQSSGDNVMMALPIKSLAIALGDAHELGRKANAGTDLQTTGWLRRNVGSRGGAGGARSGMGSAGRWSIRRRDQTERPSRSSAMLHRLDTSACPSSARQCGMNGSLDRYLIEGGIGMDLQTIENCARRSPWLIDGAHLEAEGLVVLHGVWLGEGNFFVELAPDGTCIAAFNWIEQPLHGLMDWPANDTRRGRRPPPLIGEQSSLTAAAHTTRAAQKPTMTR